MSDCRFSRRTIIAAANVLERLSQAELSRFLLELGPHFLQLVGAETYSVKKRINNIVIALDQQPDRQVDGGGLFGEVLVEKAISLIVPQRSDSPWMINTPRPDAALLTRNLERDGYVISDGELRRSLPPELGLPKAEDEVARLLDVHEFETPRGHLEQAVDAHARGDWAAANSQLRAFIEGLLDEIALRIDPESKKIKPGQHRRAHLANVTPPFLDPLLGEWAHNGVGFINGLMARLHPQGAHPGLSNEVDSTFRLHIVLISARLLLVRFDGRMHAR